MHPLLDFTLLFFKESWRVALSPTVLNKIPRRKMEFFFSLPIAFVSLRSSF